MAWTDIPAEAQNIILLQNEIRLKFVVFVVFISLAILYLSVLKKKQEKTKEMHVVVSRMLLDAYSWMMLVTSPLMVIVLLPQIAFTKFYSLFFALYGAWFMLFLLMASADVFRWGIPVLLKRFGLDMDDPEVDRIMRKYFKRKNGRK